MVEIDKKIKEESGSRIPFEVPEGYFDSFEAKIMGQIEEEVVAHVTAWERSKPYIYMAASFLVLFFIGRQVIPDSKTKTTPNIVETNIIVSDDYDVIYSQIDEYALVEFALEENIDGFISTDND